MLTVKNMDELYILTVYSVIIDSSNISLQQNRRRESTIMD